MTNRIPGYERPEIAVCECGMRTPVGPRGPVPTLCVRCQARSYYNRKASTRVYRARSLIYPVSCATCTAVFVARHAKAKWCRACGVERDRHAKRASKARSPERASLVQLRSQLKRHGLTVERYEHLLEAQGGRCAICGTDDPAPKSRFCVDHDHACCPGSHSCGACVRGLLCDQCNRTTAFGEPALLRRAADYIERYNQRSAA